MTTLTFLLILTCFQTIWSFPGSTNYEVCKTNECKRIAETWKSSMDLSVNPCDDFYEYMCGGWVRNHPIPESELAVSNFHSMRSQIEYDINDILNAPIHPGDLEPLKKAKQIYKMCMDTAKRDEVGLTPIINILNDYGGWPMVIPSSKWNGDVTPDWIKINNDISHRFALQSLYVVSTITNTLTRTNRMVTITGATFYLSGQSWNKTTSDKSMDAYRELLINVAQTFSDETRASVSKAQIIKDADDIIDFEKALWKALYNQPSYTFPRMPIKFFQSRFDRKYITKLDWYEAINSAYAKTGLHVDKTWDHIVVQKAEYFDKLAEILANTPKRTIVNYVFWSFVRKTMRHTNTRIEDILFKYNQKLYSTSKQEEKWKRCAGETNLKDAISYAYIKTYFPQNYKEHANRFVSEIGKSVRQQIMTAGWMEDSTKAAAIDKLDNMVANIGYPDWYNDSAIAKYYSNLTITNNYFENIMNYYSFASNRKLSKLKLSIDKKEWVEQPTVVNAFYDPNTNIIIFTAGILQDPLFDPNRPDVINYATAGSFIGHEVSHAYDVIGRLYDKNGKYSEWWSWNTLLSYQRRAKCFINQYNGYTIPELEVHLNKTVYVDGELSVGENIADTAGVSAAYIAYKNSLKKSGKPEIRLPGFEQFTSDQLFFMSFGNLYCENVKPSSMMLSLSDPHPRGRQRVRGSFSNMVEFAKAFNCPLNSYMNPQNKCTLWK
ncbi:neprilysin-11-like [Prorops nasuta]|uniref:neprilysin-11-like n=1 Tax=Prorops nasuta TaxID=863751 RepID=UPI0034CE548B